MGKLKFIRQALPDLTPPPSLSLCPSLDASSCPVTSFSRAFLVVVVVVIIVLFTLTTGSFSTDQLNHHHQPFLLLLLLYTENTYPSSWSLVCAPSYSSPPPPFTAPLLPCCGLPHSPRFVRITPTPLTHHPLLLLLLRRRYPPPLPPNTTTPSEIQPLVKRR